MFSCSTTNSGKGMSDTQRRILKGDQAVSCFGNPGERASCTHTQQKKSPRPKDNQYWIDGHSPLPESSEAGEHCPSLQGLTLPSLTRNTWWMEQAGKTSPHSASWQEASLFPRPKSLSFLPDTEAARHQQGPPPHPLARVAQQWAWDHLQLLSICGLLT
jgi:hypothetical protein